eukprot:scaffold4836_cov127-Isochrysis_galbana.AAC.2
MASRMDNLRPSSALLPLVVAPAAQVHVAPPAVEAVLALPAEGVRAPAAHLARSRQGAAQVVVDAPTTSGAAV